MNSQSDDVVVLSETLSLDLDEKCHEDRREGEFTNTSESSHENPTAPTLDYVIVQRWMSWTWVSCGETKMALKWNAKSLF